MDGEAVNLGKAFLDAVFERASDVVDFGDREVTVHGAMAGDEDSVIHAVDLDFVAVR